MVPRISVLTSCYNASEFLEVAIESILNQSFEDFQFILIDDGSEDDTPDIINSYAARDRRIVVVKKNHSGLADSLNTGLMEARAAWVARMDADDVSMPERLEKQFSFLEANPATVLLGCGFIEIDRYDSLIKKHHCPTSHRSLVKSLERWGPFFPHGSAVFNRQKVLGVGGYRSRFIRSQDWDLWFRLSDRGEFACLDEPLFKLRKHAATLSNDDNGRTQLLMGFTSAVCHFRRRAGLTDPAEFDEDGWRSFLAWVRRRIEEDGYFERERLWKELRNSFYSSRSDFMTMTLRHPRLAVNRIKLRLFGEALPANLALESRRYWPA
jgi:glycosyltransferase involved in cell wall biosynthesis